MDRFDHATETESEPRSVGIERKAAVEATERENTMHTGDYKVV